jgi:hypothetical protein
MAHLNFFGKLDVFQYIRLIQFLGFLFQRKIAFQSFSDIHLSYNTLIFYIFDPNYKT